MLALLLLLLACGRSPADLLREGLHAAAAGDPRAWDLCSRLDHGEGRGACRVAAARALDTAARPAACAAIVTEHWRDECWFDLAEAHAADQRWDAAMDACDEAGGFRVDCARHLAEATFARPDGDALLAALRARFPDAVEALELNRDRIAARAKDVRHPRRARGADASDPDEPGDVVSTAACAPAERDACRAAAARDLEDRWRRAATRQALRRAELCGGTAAQARSPRLRWEPDPVLDATMAALRDELCAPEPAAP